MLVSHSIGLRVLLRVLFYDWLIASVIDSNFVVNYHVSCSVIIL